MKKEIQKGIVVFAAIIGVVLNVSAQLQTPLVSPLQTGHYIPGVMSIRDYADPAPVSGLVILDYNVYVFGNKFYDQNGNRVTQITGPLGQTTQLNPDVNGYINAPIIMWVAKPKILGATYFAGVTLPYNTVNLNLAYSRIGLIKSQSGNIGGQVSGFSDLGVLPLYLSWGFKKFDLTAGYMFYAPTGTYATGGGSNNTGLGYWSHLFQVFGYYYPMEIDGKPSKALAIMFAPTLELTSKIKDADAKPGNRLSLDYGVSQYMSTKLELGIFGGNNWQISDDKGSAVYWDGTIKDANGVVGLQVGYWLLPQRLQATGKYGFNYGAQQRFEQNIFQLNLVFATNALTGNKAAKNPAAK